MDKYNVQFCVSKTVKARNFKEARLKARQAIRKGDVGRMSWEATTCDRIYNGPPNAWETKKRK